MKQDINTFKTNLEEVTKLWLTAREELRKNIKSQLVTDKMILDLEKYSKQFTKLISDNPRYLNELKYKQKWIINMKSQLFSDEKYCENELKDRKIINKLVIVETKTKEKFEKKVKKVKTK